jgi:EAL domain-containing protein (putative c-di-GMP-specific phosphodiesterase class I)
MPQALEEGSFRLAYQPIVRLSDSAVVGFEALLRWPHPELGMVAPEELLPVAEETGLIAPLTAWVIAESCARMGSWLSGRCASEPAFALHINLSNTCLADPLLIPRLAAALCANNIPASRLVVELTESFCADPEHAGRVLGQIRELGISVALDDFGTGYSSLGCLQELPVDILKIDCSFVSRLEGEESPEVLRAILGLAERLDLTVIAEGVETDLQLARLRGMGCDLAQGFLFGRPCAPERVRELLAGASYRPPLPVAEEAAPPRRALSTHLLVL